MILLRLLVIVVALSGLGVGGIAAYVQSVPLPDAAPDPQASVLYYRDGKTILARVGVTDHSDVPLAKVPVEVWRAILAAEDRDFTDHSGVSIRGMFRALFSNLRGGREGASTITQQYARNAFLTQNFSVDRKAREFALAVKLERKYTKEQILESYMNKIYFGRGAYGIAAAANAYFGVPVERLTPAQGVVLAATIKDPYHFDPAVDPRAAKNRFTWIVKSAAERKWLPAGLAYPEVAKPHSNLSGPNGQAVDQIERELLLRGITSQDLHTKGLSVVTTLDPVGQPAALKMVSDQLKAEPSGLRAALVAVDPKTGGVRAYYGSDRGRGYFDYATALHSAASTFKPIVLATALEQGISYKSHWDGSSPRIFRGRGPLVNAGNLQCKNCTLEEAMVVSANTPFYAVAERVGAEKVRDAAVRLGIPAAYNDKPSMVDGKGDPEPGVTRRDIALGAYPVTPGDLATVYGTFASGGERHERYFVESVTENDGSVLHKAKPAGRRVLDQAVAADVSAVLNSVVDGHGAAPGRPAAGKTGTQAYGNTKENQDAWMAGYTPELATVIWLGREVPGPIRDKAGKPIQGDTVPMQLWRKFVTKALEGKPTAPLPPPANLGRTDVGDANGVLPVNDDHRLTLAVDGGPSGSTEKIVEALAENGAQAVFCMSADDVRRHSGAVRRVASAGHGLCTQGNPDSAAEAIASAAGQKAVWFRDAGDSTKAAISRGMVPLPGGIALSSGLGPGDVQNGMVLRVRDQDGAADLLRKVLPQLRTAGWTFGLPDASGRTESPSFGNEKGSDKDAGKNRDKAAENAAAGKNSDKDADKGSGQGTDKGADGGNGQPDAGETAPPGNDDASGGGNLPAAPGSGTEPDSVNQGRGDTEE